MSIFRRKPKSPVPAKASARELPAKAFAPDGTKYAMVRLAHPKKPGFFYRRVNGPKDEPWATTGYMTWSIADWEERFLKSVSEDNRQWDFFGELHDIWEGEHDE